MKKIDWQKVASVLSRYFIGVVLLISGLLKINDPIGTQIKLEEYFEVFAEDFGSFFAHFVPWALEIGLVVIILEILVGVSVLLYWNMRITTWVLLLMILFFGFLTFYSAYFNKVTDCGCFGDAVALTPWESFYKDVILLIFSMYLFIYRKKYHSVVTQLPGYSLLTGVMAVSLGIGIYAINHLPYIDFRPYKVGNSIPKQMVASVPPRFEYTFSKEGNTITSNKFLPSDEGYVYVSSRVLNEKEIIPRITDFSARTINSFDTTQSLFKEAKLLLIVSQVETASISHIEAIQKLFKELQSTSIDMVILTASTTKQMNNFRRTHQLHIPFYFTDLTVLKTIIRSNPGITLWENGVVLGKWHHRDTPSFTQITSLLDKK